MQNELNTHACTHAHIHTHGNKGRRIEEGEWGESLSDPSTTTKYIVMKKEMLNL